MALSDVLAALGGCLDATTQAILAMSFGFAMIPSAIAYLIGIGGVLAFNQVVPISFQAETITLGGTIGRDINERVTIIFLGGLVMTVIGAFGWLEKVMDFAGDEIICGMMVGVGIFLGKVAFDLVKQNKKLGTVSMIVAIITYAITKDLVWTIVCGVIVTSVAAKLMKEPVEVDEDKIVTTKFKLHKLKFNFNVVRGALSVICLTIGGNIAYGGITADIAGTTANADFISIYSGLADMVSSLFGGSPVSVIISATAAAEHPQLSAILLMAFMAVILISGLLFKLARLVPVQAIAGTLFVLGIFVTIPDNAVIAFGSGDAILTLAAAVAVGVTAIVDPFFGLVAGIAVSFFAGTVGLF